MSTVEFFFDCSSPMTYLAFERVQQLKARVDCNVVLWPMFVVGVCISIAPQNSRKLR